METSHLQMLQGAPKKGDYCLMTSKDFNILDTDKYLVSFEQSGIFKYIEHRNIYFSQNVRGINDKSSKLATHTIRKL